MARKLQPGDKAPAISLPDQDGRTRDLKALAGQWVLVYFYPRDDTPGCTVEACGLRDSASEYARAGITVLGISADSVKSHRRFADKHSLPFTLLADVDRTVIRAYGAWGPKKFMGREFDGILRISYLIDPVGKLARVYPKVKPAEHAAQVLADVAELRNAAPATATKPGRARRPSKAPSKASSKSPKPASRKRSKKAARKAPKTARPARKTGRKA